MVSSDSDITSQVNNLFNSTNWKVSAVRSSFTVTISKNPKVFLRVFWFAVAFVIVKNSCNCLLLSAYVFTSIALRHSISAFLFVVLAVVSRFAIVARRNGYLAQFATTATFLVVVMFACAHVAQNSLHMSHFFYLLPTIFPVPLQKIRAKSKMCAKRVVVLGGT